MTPVAIITGASAGIGAELARVFARNGHALVLIARRAQRLHELAAEIRANGGAVPLVLPLDLTERNVSAKIHEALAVYDLDVEYVVNNAGFGSVGAAADRDRDDQLAMIDLNMRALTDLSLAFLESLTRRRGGILNVASVAGFLPGPRSAVYYATKSYVLSFSESLQRELRHQVRVTTLCPGPVLTEFQSRAGTNSHRTPLLDVSAARVAEAGYRGLMQGKTLVIPGTGNKIMAFLPRIMPRRLLLTLTGRRQRARMVSSATGT